MATSLSSSMRRFGAARATLRSIASTTAPSASAVSSSSAPPSSAPSGPASPSAGSTRVFARSFNSLAQRPSSPATGPRQQARLFRSSATLLKEDYYKLLGLEKGASKQDIKKAYFQQAKQYHPDANPDDETAAAKFGEISEAYEVLSDDEKKATYDQFGHAGMNQQGGFGGPGGGPGFDPRDIFSQFESMFGGEFGGGGFGGFGGGAMRGAMNRAEDVQGTVRLSFVEAAKGCEKSVKLRMKDTCGTCDGKGTASGKEPATCGACQGTGVVMHRQGYYQVQAPCGQCRGEGVVILDPCGTCGGQGVVEQLRTIEVTVPPGVDSGMSMRLAGQGEAGRRGAGRGNLFLRFVVDGHKDFARDGPHIRSKVELSIAEAALGVSREVNTLDGAVDLKVRSSLFVWRRRKRRRGRRRRASWRRRRRYLRHGHIDAVIDHRRRRDTTAGGVSPPPSVFL